MSCTATLEVEPEPSMGRNDRDTVGDALRYGEAGAISEGQARSGGPRHHRGRH
jgi:hypothetical protein